MSPQAPGEHLLPACAEHGVGVIVRVALDEGGLTGRIERNTAVGDGRGLSAGQQAIVARHRWERNFYPS